MARNVGAGEILFPDVEAETPTDDQLVAYWGTLTRATKLRVNGSSRIAQLLLSPHAAATVLPALQSLCLSAEFASWPNPFDPFHYKHLIEYHELITFTILIQRHANTIFDEEEEPLRTSDASREDSAEAEELEPEEGSPGGSRSENQLPDIAYISVAGALGHPAAVRILAIAPRPYGLELLAFGDIASFVPFLDAHTDPRCLTSLFLCNGHCASTAPIDHALLRFTSLQRLSLTAETRGPDLFTKVLTNTLPIIYLTLAQGMDVSTADVLGLLEGPTRLRTLKELTLDLIDEGDEGEMGDDPLEGWTMPDWTMVFPREGAGSVLAAADKAGVVVTGRVAQAMKVEQAYAAAENAWSAAHGRRES